jgi:hypothetical protein
MKVSRNGLRGPSGRSSRSAPELRWNLLLQSHSGRVLEACDSAGRGRWAGPSPVKFYSHFLGSLYGDPFASCASSRGVSRFP